MSWQPYEINVKFLIARDSDTHDVDIDTMLIEGEEVSSKDFMDIISTDLRSGTLGDLVRNAFRDAIVARNEYMRENQEQSIAEEMVEIKDAVDKLFKREV